MKEIIPLKKDIVFKTAIGQITDINLEHNYDIKDNLVEGNVLLYGSYKMTEASVIEEDFNYKIPFGVSISKNINKDTIKIEIDDFKYDINNDVMSVSVDLEFSCDEVEENNIVFEEPLIEEEKEITINESNNDIDIDQNITNITNNIVTNDQKYYTYKIYIVREIDTLESICKKYNVSENELKEYNNLTNINIGDKIIIPYINE